MHSRFMQISIQQDGKGTLFFLSLGFLDNFLKDLEKFTTMHNESEEDF